MAAAKKTKTKPTSIVTFLLDRSASMASCREATIEGFNAYLITLKAEKDAKIDFTFLQFDTLGIDKICVAMPVATVPELTPATYQPRASTPLIEAATKTINAVEAALKTRDDKPKVVVCFQTDGQENSSGPEYTWEGLRALITAKQAEGWAFNFLGAGIDAYQQGAMMGVAVSDTMSYDSKDRISTMAAFRASASNASGFASGQLRSTSYTVEQKASAKDRFVPQPGAHVPNVPHPFTVPIAPNPAWSIGPGMPLDLTKPAAPPKPNADLDLTTP